MATKNKVKTEKAILPDGKGMRIGIVTSEWNKHITHSLREGCEHTLVKAGVSSEDITHLSVPGAFELPMGARNLLASEKLDGIVCLGCVIKGETDHDIYINQSVAQGIMQLGLTSGKPVIFGVLTPNSEAQAIERSGGELGNKGDEAAETVLAMVKQAKELKDVKKGIGFS